MSLIALDLGTSFIKGAVLDLDTLRLVDVHRIPFPDPLPGLPPLYREFAPQRVLDSVRVLLNDLATFAPDCEGLVMCTQMHGIVWTTPDGEARSNLTTWQDQRVLMPHPSGTGTYFEVMKRWLSVDERRQLGNELRPGLPVGLFFWLAEQRQLPDADLIPAALSDFVLANLCGALPVTETTNAMAHGLLNLDTMDWHDEVIAKLGLEDIRLPALKPHGAVVGWLPFGGRSIPCYTPIGDYQCAILGALLRDDELSLNISTGSQVSLLQPKAVFGDFQTRPFFDGRFAITITHIPAGRALNALVKLLSELAVSQGVELADPWDYIARRAADSGDTTLRVNLAFYSSACGDHGAITAIQESELTVGHLFRAAFQNMADNYYQCALRLAPDQDWRQIVFSGGLVQKVDILRKTICDRFGASHRLSPSAEDTLLGLLALGLAFTGRAATVAAATDLLFERYQEV